MIIVSLNLQNATGAYGKKPGQEKLSVPFVWEEHIFSLLAVTMTLAKFGHLCMRKIWQISSSVLCLYVAKVHTFDFQIEV